MIAWVLSFYLCTGPSFLNMGPGCHWENYAGPPFRRRIECGDYGKAHVDNKNNRLYRCTPIWAISGQPVQDDAH